MRTPGLLGEAIQSGAGVSAAKNSGSPSRNELEPPPPKNPKSPSWRPLKPQTEIECRLDDRCSFAGIDCRTWRRSFKRTARRLMGGKIGQPFRARRRHARGYHCVKKACCVSCAGLECVCCEPTHFFSAVYHAMQLDLQSTALDWKGSVGSVWCAKRERRGAAR